MTVENIFCFIIALIIAITVLRLQKLEERDRRNGLQVNSRDYRLENIIKNFFKKRGKKNEKRKESRKK